jgi:hypothetical protein
VFQFEHAIVHPPEFAPQPKPSGNRHRPLRGGELGEDRKQIGLRGIVHPQHSQVATGQADASDVRQLDRFLGSQCESQVAAVSNRATPAVDSEQHQVHRHIHAIEGTACHSRTPSPRCGDDAGRRVNGPAFMVLQEERATSPNPLLLFATFPGLAVIVAESWVGAVCVGQAASSH